VQLDLADAGLERAILLGLLRLAPEESRRFSSSDTRSATRRRLASVASSFRSAALRRDLYFVTPAASSMMLRRSSGLAETMRPTRPCSMML
jgi:hypothetical protein